MDEIFDDDFLFEDEEVEDPDFLTEYDEEEEEDELLINSFVLFDL